MGKGESALCQQIFQPLGVSGHLIKGRQTVQSQEVSSRVPPASDTGGSFASKYFLQITAQLYLNYLGLYSDALYLRGP